MSLKIAFVTETYPPEVNGVAMTVGRLVSGLRQLGHRVEVLRPRQQGDASPVAEDALFPSLGLPGYPGLRFGLPAGRQLARRWQQARPDLVHVVTEGPLGWSAVATARRLGIPVTSGFHTNFDRYSMHYGLGWLRPAVSAYLRTLHRRTLATMVPTQALAAELAGEGVPGVHVVGRGVDVAHFSPQQRSDSLRRAWGLAGDELACLYVGRLAAEKNLALAEAAFAAIQAQHPKARMIWVGDGPARSKLAAAHPEHRFAGVQIGQPLAAHYASADLFLFPSLSETYGNVVAEAMASGLPVLAYRSAAAAELIEPGDNGQVVSPGDERSFITTACLLAGDAPLRQQLGERACDSVAARNWPEVIAQFEGVLRGVLATPYA